MKKNTAESCATQLRERSTPAGDCLEWQGARNYKGYGLLNFQGKTDKAHRVAYALANGAIPAGAHVMHKCDNRCCVNPAHLSLGTNQANIADKVAKDRASKRLTLEKAMEIKGMIGKMSQTEIARMFDITQSTVSRIGTGSRRPILAGRV